MPAVGHDHGAGAASVGSVYQHAFVAGFLDNALDGSRFRADDGNNAVGGDDIAEADIDKLDIHYSLSYSIF